MRITITKKNKAKKKSKPWKYFLSSFLPSLKDEVSWIEWKKALSDALVESKHLYTVTEKVTKIYGAGAADVKRITVQDWNLFSHIFLYIHTNIYIDYTYINIYFFRFLNIYIYVPYTYKYLYIQKSSSFKNFKPFLFIYIYIL